MEIRTLRYFLAVARKENMTRAAEQLHVTQPTLSKPFLPVIFRRLNVFYGKSNQIFSEICFFNQ